MKLKNIFPICKFKERCKKEGLIENYTSTKEFRDKFRRQLAKIVSDYFIPKLGKSATKIETRIEMSISLSDEAKKLRVEAAKDTNGAIMRAEYKGGMDITTNGKNFISDKSARTRALWDRALRELEKNGFIERRPDARNIFVVTRMGYEMADKIKSDISLGQ